MSAEVLRKAASPRRHLPGCVLDPDHGAGCVRQQWAAEDPDAPWNRPIPPASTDETGDDQ